MKAMVDAKHEPFYSTFVALKSSSYSSTSGSVSDRGTQIKEGAHNGTIGIDGRKAHDLALLYRITGDKAYGDRAVKYLNANSNYTNVSARGTGPLDGGKINLLIEAAELMRDYPGWSAADQQRFKDMLVYPGYTTSENLYDKYASIDDSANGITFYWNCFNFDAGRFGNQGMFAARALLAMGVYLDNDTIFDRAFQYLNGTPEKHFEQYNDLPYVPGPRYHGANFSSVEQCIITASTTQDYQTQANYGYDEQLTHYIFKNGQCQESCRDQGHTQCGIMMYVNLAEQCWNQGEDLYGAYDNRILKGIEYSTRVNLTAVSDYSNYCNDKNWNAQWVPTSYSVTGTKPSESWVPTDEDLVNNVEPEDPNVFYQTWSRSGRWFYKDLTTADAGDVLGSSGCREMAYAHYKVRMGMDNANLSWLSKDRNYLLKKYGYENWGKDSGHYYEWCGWGTLSKFRNAYMTGDPVSYQSGARVMGAHSVFETVHFVDFDYFTALGNGRTYYDTTSDYAKVYRTDEQVDIEEGDDNYVIANVGNEEWWNYTYIVPVAGTYSLNVRYAAGENSPMISLMVDGEEKGDIFTQNTNGEYVTESISDISLEAGCHVFRMIVNGEDADLKLSTLELTTSATAYTIEYTDGVSGIGKALAGQLVSVRPESNLVAGSILVYDPATDAAVTQIPATDGGVVFTMPANNVQVTGLAHPEDGVTYLATIATTTAGAGSAYARANHPDVFSVDVPLSDAIYKKAIYTHPYKAHNYNRTNLRLVCPDGETINVNSDYDKPWDVSGHIVPGQTNTFTLLNDHNNGIDYWANGIATKAEYLTRLTLSDPDPTALEEIHTPSSDEETCYNLQGLRVEKPGKGMYIVGRKIRLYF